MQAKVLLSKINFVRADQIKLSMASSQPNDYNILKMVIFYSFIANTINDAKENVIGVSNKR